jgi:ABC-type Na+ efflux pump permease subunit
MATQGRGKKLPTKSSVPSSDYYIPPVPVAVAPVRESVKEDIVAAILLCLSLALLLPLGAILYLDVLQTNKEVKLELQKLEKLRREIESQQRKDKDK